MNDPNTPYLHGWNQPQGFGGEMYPGLGDPFAGPPALQNPKVIPAQGASKPGLLGNLGNIGELKNMIDRVGGIDGILSTMGKFQKFIASMQQFAPLLRLFMGKAVGAKAAAAGKSGARRRTRRRKTGKAAVRSRRRTNRP